eukprot:NODE_1644_length_783_cov_89.861280_g1595_i0.p1 GENE.NODE_1644_length_783_cov_89.861280_g1595_i0~~NODE_1644_length_783_cov_89.861280_g1595_i0.p1  ORF type:complete len:209 (-),score=23.57 NODE_1644_length_783_cov_89.861280_g1595_i0:63-689(-)
MDRASPDTGGGHIVIDIQALQQQTDYGPSTRPSLSVQTAPNEDTEQELMARLSTFSWKQSFVTALTEGAQGPSATQIHMQLADFIIFTRGESYTTNDVYLLSFVPRGIPPECPRLSMQCKNIVLAVHLEMVPDNGGKVTIDQFVEVRRDKFGKVREKRGGSVSRRSKQTIEELKLTLFVFINSSEELEKIVIKQCKSDFWAMIECHSP